MTLFLLVRYHGSDLPVQCVSLCLGIDAEDARAEIAFLREHGLPHWKEQLDTVEQRLQSASSRK